MGVVRRALAASADDGHDDDHDEDHFLDFGLGVFVMALAFGIIARQINAGARLAHSYTSRKLLELLSRFPYTVFVLLLGFIVGVTFRAGESQGKDRFGDSLTHGLERWTDVSPEVILFAFIPILLFESSFSTDVHIIRHEALQVLFLAGPGVIVSTFLTALFVKYVFNYGWSWTLCLLFGSMMSATDPVAVVALFKDLGVNQRLGTLIEGEGLMNDGSAIVIFNICLAAIEKRRTNNAGLSAGDVVTTALQLSLGGPVVGLVLGAIMSTILGNIINDLKSEVTLTVVGCYACFLVAEGSKLHVSGVLAVVFAGLYLSFYGRGKISIKVEHSLHSFWHIAEYVADTVIFFIAGVVMAVRIFSNHTSGSDWGKLVLLYLALHGIRLFIVTLSWPILKRGYGLTYKEGLVLVFGGLRGAIGLSLALIIEDTEDVQDTETNADRVVFHMAGIALLTLIINGTFMKPLINYLGLDRVSKAESEMFEHSCAVIEAKLEHFVENELKPDRFLGDADYSVVWRYIPVLSAQQYWHRIKSHKLILTQREKEVMRHVNMAVAQRRNPNLDSPPKGLSLSWEGSWTSDNGDPLPTARRERADNLHMSGNPSSRDTASSSTDESRKRLSGHNSSSRDEETTPMPLAALDPATVSYFRPCRPTEPTKFVKSAYDHVPTRLRRYWHEVHLTHAAHEPTSEDQAFQTGKLAAAAAAAANSKTNASVSGTFKVPVRSGSDKLASPVPSQRPGSGASSGAGGGGSTRSRPSSFRSRLDPTRKLVEQREILNQQLRVVEEELRKNQFENAQKNARMRAKTRANAQQEAARRSNWGMTVGVGSLGVELQAIRQLSPSPATDGLESTMDAEKYMESCMPKARARFITAVRAQYQANHHVGRMSAHALRTLRESADNMLDNPDKELHDWDFLEPKLQMSPKLQQLARRFAKVPLLGKVMFNLIYEQLAFMQELAAEFVHAHQAIDIYELLDKGELADRLVSENYKQMKKVHDLLQQQLPVFPEIAHALKTQMAARQLLNFHARVIDHLVEHGNITEREYELFNHKSDEMQSKLRAHPLTEELPKRFEMLSKADFMRNVPEVDVQRIADSSSICNEFFVEPSCTLFRPGETHVHHPTAKRFLSNENRNGWFLVVRGMVRKRIPKKRSNFSSLDFDGARSRGAAAARSPDGSPKAPEEMGQSGDAQESGEQRRHAKGLDALPSTVNEGSEDGMSPGLRSPVAETKDPMEPAPLAGVGKNDSSKKSASKARRKTQFDLSGMHVKQDSENFEDCEEDDDGEGGNVVIIQPGSTFGMEEALLGQKFRAEFVTSSYCHLIYIDTVAYLKEAQQNQAVFDTLFRALAAQVVPRLLGVKLAAQAFLNTSFVEVKSEVVLRDDSAYATDVLEHSEGVCSGRVFTDLHEVLPSTQHPSSTSSYHRNSSFGPSSMSTRRGSQSFSSGHNESSTQSIGGEQVPVLDMYGKAPAWHRRASMVQNLHSTGSRLKLGLRTPSMGHVLSGLTTPLTPSVSTGAAGIPDGRQQPAVSVDGKKDCQYIVELWRERWYMLLRGRVLGRASQSLAAAQHRLETIENFKALAESSAKEEMIRHEDLQQLESIVARISSPQKEDEAPVENVAERWAPTLIKNLHGRIRVSGRTVIMELPNEFKACKAAMKFLSKLRRRRSVNSLSATESVEDSLLLGEADEKPMSLAQVVEKLRAIAAIHTPTPLGTPLPTPLGTPLATPRNHSPKHRNGIESLTYDSDGQDDREVVTEAIHRLSVHGAAHHKRLPHWMEEGEDDEGDRDDASSMSPHSAPQLLRSSEDVLHHLEHPPYPEDEDPDAQKPSGQLGLEDEEDEEDEDFVEQVTSQPMSEADLFQAVQMEEVSDGEVFSVPAEKNPPPRGGAEEQGPEATTAPRGTPETRPQNSPPLLAIEVLEASNRHGQVSSSSAASRLFPTMPGDSPASSSEGRRWD